MALVADVSAVLGGALAEDDMRYALAVLRAIGADEAHVPTLFWFELRNALLMAERRKRVTGAQLATFLGEFAILPVSVDSAPSESTVLDLARRHDLTVYDAAYLELAQRKQLPLATLGSALRKAARKARVSVFKSK